MKNKKIIKTLIITITLIMFLGIKNIYAAQGTIRMQINNGTPWTNINISESYEACENLNKPTSTLGTTLLEAHLTTDEDWSAMAVFSVSQMEQQLQMHLVQQQEIYLEYIIQVELEPRVQDYQQLPNLQQMFM